MKIKATLPWFGSKRFLADDILKVIGHHSCWWEPFCGSLSMLFAKRRAKMETVNDLHGDAINLARTVQNPSKCEELFRRLLYTIPSKELWKDAAELIRGEQFQPTIERAYNFFVMSWLGRNGVAGSNGGSNFCARFSHNGGAPGTRFKAAVDSIPEWLERLRSVVILNEDGFGLLERIQDEAGTVIYCDPPYVVKGANYIHDFKKDDHERLRDLLARFRRVRIAVSYYDHPLVEELYEGWEKIELDASKAMVNPTKKKTEATKAPEVLFINYNKVSTLF